MPPYVPAPLPQTFGPYTLLRSLGHGGTAEIFLARRRGQREPVVIKRLLPELSEEVQFLSMLVGEAKVAALLDHPAIVRIHELGKEGGLVYLAMEYVRGWDLHTLVKVAGGRVPPPIAARIGLAVAEALAHAHQRTDLQGRPLHLVHRDVTPSNVMITPAGEVKLIDFGVAKAQTQLTFTQPGVVKGKFRYMSPEQIEQKPLDGRSDLFALGVTLYEVSTGERAFDRKQIVDILRAVLRYEPEPPSSVVEGYPRALEAVVLRALQKDRDRRYADGAAMARDLREALKGMRGPSDVGAWARELAARHPDTLRPPPELTPEPADSPFAGVEDRSGAAEFKPELTLVNLSEPEPQAREQDSDPRPKWMTEPLRVKIAQPLGPPSDRHRRDTDPDESWRDETERNSDDEDTVDGLWRDHTEPDPHWKEKTAPMPPPEAPAAAAIPLPQPPVHARAEPAWTDRPVVAPVESGPHRLPRRASFVPAVVGLVLLAAASIAGTWAVLQLLLKK